MIIFIYIFLILTTEPQKNHIESDSGTYISTRIDYPEFVNDKRTKYINDGLLNDKSKQIYKSDIIENDFSEYTGVRKDPLERNFHSLRYLNRNMSQDDRDINLTQSPLYTNDNGSYKIVGYTEKDSKKIVCLDDTKKISHDSFLNMSDDNLYIDQYKNPPNTSESDINNYSDNQDYSREIFNENELPKRRFSTSSRRSNLVDSSSQTENISLPISIRRKSENLNRGHKSKCNPGEYNKSSNSRANSVKSSCNKESYDLNNSISMTDLRKNSSKNRSSSTNFDENIIDSKHPSSRIVRSSLSSLGKIYHTSQSEISRPINNFVNLKIRLIVKNHPEYTYPVKIYKRDLYNTIDELMRILLKDDYQLKNFIRLLKSFIKNNAKTSLSKRFKKGFKSLFGDDTKNTVLLHLLNLDRDDNLMNTLIDNENIIIYHNDSYTEIMGKLKGSFSENSKEFVVYENNQKISLYYLVVHTLLNHLNKRFC